ncbi:ABC transporter permease [Sandarakinorhabdus limnophila]|uniref:ABC transporter permease n=1 Tax=Sandarakinorhabdus limnophila TaxID=210512 RepID=UPI0026E9DBDD|nr:ABC transporter permease [Sandarakinorhabdus limnophila]
MNAENKLPAHPEPGMPVIARLNTEGLKTLYLKEVRRFFKVQLQTIWAPAVTTLMFLVIFAVALGRGDILILGVPYADFLGPGLIVMGMIQNSFANTSSSILVAKVQGSIIDVLMPPLSAGELMLAWVGGAVTRAWLVGLAVWMVMAVAPGVNVPMKDPLLVLYFGTMGAILLALLGILTGVWADKFDHAAAATNFVIQPLTLLSGTFYAVERLGPTVAGIAHANPFFHVINGFRAGFLGVSDGPLGQSALLLALVNVALWFLCYRVVKSGWKLRA